MRYDLRGHTWNKVRRKSGKKPSKSTDPCQRTETVGIGLTPSSLTRAFKASSAG
jgi:hypothetical protein